MGKKNEKFAKIYREFTRVKYDKYRLQFPRVRQSELISKIIREWEAMDDEAKYDLQRKYDQGSGISFIESASSSSPKNQQKKPKAEVPAASSAKLTKQKKITKKKPPSPKVKVFVESSIKKSPEELADYVAKDRENSKSPGKKSTPERNHSSSSQLQIQIARGDGRIPQQKAKTKAQQYQNFYKYYYERLVAEHPRWTKPQIATIIKLLWKKRLATKIKRKKSISSKPLSGRQLYSKTKASEGLLKDQIKQLWRALPFECKKYWQIKGRGRPNRSERAASNPLRRVLNGGATKEAGRDQESTLSWMNQQIK